MTGRRFATVSLASTTDAPPDLGALPPCAGVGQFLGDGGSSLLIAQPANLRRWAAANLGRGTPKRGRPRLDLRPIARQVRYATTRSGFEQRLVYERLMARHVPLATRRDLSIPAFLRLDAGERFPRVSVAIRGEGATPLYGPLRDRRAAAAAREALQRRLRLRPCDYVFEPDPGLALGLGCVYAQVRSCAAPCLARIEEAAYRAIAAEAAVLLSVPSRRTGEAADWLPEWVGPAAGPALVVERAADELQLFPIRDGAVLDDEAVTVGHAALEAALGRLRFAPVPGRDDTPWLVAWLRTPRRGGAYLVVEDRLGGSAELLAEAVLSALARRGRGSPAAP